MTAVTPPSGESSSPGAPFPQDAIPGLPCNGDGPVFSAPWEAQAFAMALALHQQGLFTWNEWAATLAAVIREVRQREEPDTGEQYYRHWLEALERIASAKGLVTPALLHERRRQWESAALRTPHGQPISLATTED